MFGFGGYLESFRLSLGMPLCKDLAQYSALSCNANEIFETLADITKKAPKSCRSHTDQATVLLLYFLFEEDSSFNPKVLHVGILSTGRWSPNT